jgi:hypothetical protein
MNTQGKLASGVLPLELAQAKFYEMAGGSLTSGNVEASQLTTAMRMEYFRTTEFRNWVASEKAAGREVFWLKDVDKTQAAGDLFTFFFQWRVDNNAFSQAHLESISQYLVNHENAPAQIQGAPQDAINLWLTSEAGGKGIELLDLWSNIYWPSQLGMTEAEKLRQVQAFAPTYASRIYAGVREENELLEEIGVNVVIVSNGDQELAIACAPFLGIKPENVTGSNLIYGADGLSTGVNHTYEVNLKDWNVRPQPGKPLGFHYWLHNSRGRWGWDNIDERKFVIGGRDGDSASSDGGMMILMPSTAAIGNFMVNTPGEKGRITKFYALAAKYGWTKGQFITLNQKAGKLGFKP